MKRNTLWSPKVNKIQSFYFNYNLLDEDSFIKLILNNFEFGVIYSMLIRVEYNGGRYGMAGNQIGFKLEPYNYLEKIQMLYKYIQFRIGNFNELYDIESIDSIQILFVKVKILPKLKLQNTKDLILPKKIVNNKEIRSKYNNNFLPLTVNTAYFGKLIGDNESKKYIDIIQEQESLIGKNVGQMAYDTMFLYKDKYIILNYNLKPNTFKREVFDNKLGVLEGRFVDVILSKNSFERMYNNVSVLVSKEQINEIKVSKKLKSIKSNFIKSKQENKSISNPRIGTFDIEAFDDSDGYAKVYALGYCVLNKDPVTFYIDLDKNHDILIECIDKMLLNNFNDYIFYIHNINYDGIFIIHKIKEFNRIKGFDFYKLDVIFKDSYILKIKISSQDNKNKLTFVDSSNLLKGSLNSLCKSFDLKGLIKGHFPYKFVNKNTLNYVGVTPDYHYWDNLSYNEYENLKTNNWNLKQECILYLERDLLSLLEIMSLFSKYIFRKFDVQVSESLTISRLSLNIYLKYYLNKSNIPIIKDNLYKDIKEAYYGGITEVYKPYGENLFYYDVNSLYPYVSMNPMCGIQYTYIESFNEGLDLNQLFGFFYCKIETNNNYLGLLPVKNDKGLIMPLGSWEGWYFSEELKFAEANGYKIKVIKGYNFNKEYQVFDKYVKDIYDIKCNTDNPVERTVAKSLLNNLLGRFGLNINKAVTEIVDNEKLDTLLSTRECNSFKKINDDSYLISYYPKISRNICESFGNDYIKILQENNSSKLNQEFKDVSLVISAAITSYARIYMNKIKLDILKSGGQIYYTDTDSIVTDIPLDERYVDNKEIGKLKLEYGNKIKKAYFISSKTYGLILNDGSSVLKTKGLLSKSLDIIDFEKLYEGTNVQGTKKSALRDYGQGSVTISDKTIILNANSYTKRLKVFDKNRWVDTKPLIIDSNLGKVESNLDSTDESNLESKQAKFSFKSSIKINPPNIYIKTSWKLLREFSLFLISFLFVGFMGGFLDLDSLQNNDVLRDSGNYDTSRSGNYDTSRSGDYDKNICNENTFYHRKFNGLDKSLILKYSENKNISISIDKYNINDNNSEDKLFSWMIHELLSQTKMGGKFRNKKSIVDFSYKYLLEQKELNITTSQVLSLLKKVNNLDSNNNELYNLLVSKTFKKEKPNLVSKRFLNEYEKWIRDSSQNEPRYPMLKNELSVFDEIEKLNQNYTTLLNEYKWDLKK